MPDTNASRQTGDGHEHLTLFDFSGFRTYQALPIPERIFLLP